MGGIKFISPQSRENYSPKGRKVSFDGVGNIIDENGDSSLLGSVAVRSWWNTSPYFSIQLVLTLVIFFGGGYAWKIHGPFGIIDASVFCLWVLLSIALWYLTLAVGLNITRFEIGEDELSVSIGPFWLPWIEKSRHFKKPELEQVFVNKYQSYRSNGPGGARPYFAHRIYVQPKVLAHLSFTEKQPICIDSGIREYEDARILEQWIEKKLGIEDRDHPDEVSEK